MKNVYYVLVSVLIILSSCVQPQTTPAVKSEEQRLILESNRFNTIKTGVLSQIYTGQGNQIPVEKIPSLGLAIEQAHNKITTARKIQLPSLQETFVLEASQLLEISDIIQPNITQLKGLLILGAKTQENYFDWVMMAAINLETWKPLKVKFNTQFGETSRTLQPDSTTFTTLNDYAQMLGTAKNSKQYATKYALRRVFVPNSDEAINFDDLSSFQAYLPAVEPEKRFILNQSKEVQQLQIQSVSSLQIQSKSILKKVGTLR